MAEPLPVWVPEWLDKGSTSVSIYPMLLCEQKDNFYWVVTIIPCGDHLLQQFVNTNTSLQYDSILRKNVGFKNTKYWRIIYSFIQQILIECLINAKH